jgi:hypothetical protein
MRESRKSQLAGIAGAIGIAILAFFLIFALNSLNWPIAASLGKAITVIPSPTQVPDGILVVNVQSSLTVIPGSAVPRLVDVPVPSSVQQSENLSGVRVWIYISLNTQPSVSNITNAQGQVQENLAPNSYTVKLVDWRLNNLSSAVQISSDKITNLNVTLNATSYAIQSSSISDPDFSGYAVSWGHIYAQLNSNQSVTAQNPSTYLDTEYSVFTPLSRITQSGVTPVTIGSSTQNNGSQWVQIQVNAPLNISSIRSMSILALHAQSSVSTYAIQ